MGINGKICFIYLACFHPLFRQESQSERKNSIPDVCRICLPFWPFLLRFVCFRLLCLSNCHWVFLYITTTSYKYILVILIFIFTLKILRYYISVCYFHRMDACHCALRSFVLPTKFPTTKITSWLILQMEKQ